MKRPKSPCKDCPKHEFGCKKNCPEWQEYESAYTEYTKEREQQYEMNREVEEYHRNVVDKVLRREKR